jgi:hypothetical protein
MKRLKSKVIYHGGSIPVPSHLQKGIIELKDNRLHFTAKGDSEKYNIRMAIPVGHIKSAITEERKYYSSVGYFLVLKYLDDKGKEQILELEIRSFVRRGRAQYFAKQWAEILSGRA